MKADLTLVLATVLPLMANTGCSEMRTNATEFDSLEQGRWTGIMSWEDSGVRSRLGVTYDVILKGNTIDITMHGGEQGSFPLSEVELNDGTLTFWISPGARAHCTLTRRDDGAFEGPCIAEGHPPETRLCEC